MEPGTEYEINKWKNDYFKVYIIYKQVYIISIFKTDIAEIFTFYNSLKGPKWGTVYRIANTWKWI